MDYSAHNKLVSFIWSIADDCLRDVYVRGKYRDVILPMVVLRRLDTLLEPSKEAVLEEVRFQREDMEATELDDEPLMAVSNYVFYNTSKWTLKKLKETATNNQQILLENVDDYLNGFSDNVKEIIKCFKLKAQVQHMASKDVLLGVLEKFVSPNINLTPFEIEDPDGNKLAALTNLGMGYVFEELIRKFNEDNNEEAGEHFTPREVIELMTHLVFDPIKDHLQPVMSIYDPACGSGGMLTESQNFIKEKYPTSGLSVGMKRDIHLFGKEINDETYAICKSDMMIKGNDPENIKVGSTLSTNDFAAERFDFCLSNPPYGKSWASEQKYIKEGNDVIDTRFIIKLCDYWGALSDVDAVPRSSDGQLLFLMEMVDKMKPTASSPHGSRIASVHNGSSLFTGDAGSGESNIRRYLIENDMLDAIIQLPNNLFYNTGISTYIWLLSNNKSANRQGKVQLIDASLLFKKLRKNLGNKNCEFSSKHIEEITQAYMELAQIERELDSQGDVTGIATQVFDNEDFGYYKVNIERPDRRKVQFSPARIAVLRFDKSLREPMEYIYQTYGEAVYQTDFFKANDKNNEKAIIAWCEENEISLNTKARSKLFDVKTWLKLQALVDTANELMAVVGTNEYNDFNQFKVDVDVALKPILKARAERAKKQKESDSKAKFSSGDKNAILNAVSWYDESAEKIIKKVEKFKQEKLDTLLEHLGCKQSDLVDFGYFPITKGQTKKTNEYITYESSSDLRDAESIPLKDDQGTNIHQYFLAEVKPHVDEAWINLDSTKIGYEISFNKYFYQHKPLRSMDEVAKEIVDLELKAEGLIADILGVDLAKVQG
jgi:type I restriction enzyme M protein